MESVGPWQSPLIKILSRSQQQEYFGVFALWVDLGLSLETARRLSDSIDRVLHVGAID